LNRLVSLAGALAIAGASAAIVAAAGQAGSATGKVPEQQAAPAQKTAAAAKAWTPGRTAWGEPDLQGVWSNATITPLERRDGQSGKDLLSDEEAAALNSEAESRAEDRSGAGTDADVARAYNAFWWDRGKSLARTSLIVDPAEGKLPPLTAEGQKRRQAAMDARKLRGPADSWEDRPLQERCILYHGVPPLPTGYNNNYQIVQTPGYVAIYSEMIHEIRLIPVDARAHLASTIGQWMGDSRGHWEGDTLVVETTNFDARTTFRFPAANETIRVIERFKRVAPDKIDYQFTVQDPTTYTRPWTALLPMTRIDGPIYEYACHEGNYGMFGILSGHRAQEKAAEDAAKKGSR
jgi:hypothetical protein